MKIAISLSEEYMPVMRWTTATQLDRWADTRQSQGQLPHLIRRLIMASCTPLRPPQIPVHDSIYRPGWDGILVARDDEANEFIPQGLSVWEFGTDQDPARKANKEFSKRRSDPGAGITPANTTFVFVTPRRWLQKREWEEAKRQEGPWRDVRVYDAEDLELWLESMPAVGSWWAKELGPAPLDALSLEDWWTEWSGATTPALTSALILAGRENYVGDMGQWLEGTPSVLTLKSSSPEESIAFFAAVAQALPEDQRQLIDARTFVTSSSDFLRQFAPNKRPHIVVTLQCEIGLAASLARRGHHVLLPVGNDTPDNGQCLKLNRPAREPFIKQLKLMGLEDDQSELLAESTGRSLAILRRRLTPTGLINVPEWALPQNGPLLIPALLANSWEESNEHDRQVIAGLSGRPYDELSVLWARWRNVPDSPFTCVGGAWKLTSTEDAWDMLARFLTGPDLDRFEQMVQTTLGQDDPIFELPPDKRWCATLYNKERPHSGRLIQGLARSINRMGSLQCSGAQDQMIPVQSRANQLVYNLLRDAQGIRWASLASCLPDLAEASPSQFLASLENSLAQPTPPVMEMFANDEFMGGSTHAHLLWALEVLAWLPEHFGRVALALAQLDRLDSGGKRGNQPSNSLKSILWPFAPQSTTTMEQRIETLRMLQNRESVAFWKLIFHILPGHSSIWTHNARPKFRKGIAPLPNSYYPHKITVEYEAITDLIREGITNEIEHWPTLWEKYSNLTPRDRGKIIETFTSCLQTITNSPDTRIATAKAIRNLLNHHNSYPDAKWSLPREELDSVEQVFRQIEPEDLHRYTWLFDDGYPNFIEGGVISAEGHQEKVQSEREKAALEIHKRYGFQGLLDLSDLVEMPRSLGFSLRLVEGIENCETAICSLLSQPEGSGRLGLATGYISCLIYPLANGNFKRLTQRAISEQWQPTSQKVLFRLAPTCREVWDTLDSFDESIQKDYWDHAYPDFRDATEDDILFGVISYLQYENAPAALNSIAHHGKRLPSGLLVQVLECCITHQKQSGNEAGNIRDYYIEQAFEELRKRTDIPEMTIGLLEWRYLPAFDRGEPLNLVLHTTLAKQPKMFIDFLAMVYHPEGEDQTEEEPTEERARLAENAYRFLSTWATPPGLGDTGAIDLEVLTAWIAEARKLAADHGFSRACDYNIGDMLGRYAGSIFRGEDWPPAAICHIIEEIRSSNIDKSFRRSIQNARGVVSRSLSEGGAQERALAASFFECSERIGLQWPRTAGILRDIAEGYEREAAREDSEAKRRDLNL